MVPVLVVILIIVILIIIAVILRKRSSSNHTSRRKVIPFKSGSRSRALKQGQACSRCNRKRPLVFYANDAGIVKGLCKECKNKLEQHQELYPV
ncbi:hypothetical protein JCM10914A_32760 [Paenibacillus sp. JCM 10914]|uniref:hypothetical protein n=1 Tax=Paenibacillus sp. JCM 10914 TaxID=1236974 RepID=UPI00068ADC7C|nr:hypothetical protein [Paenibacillus sp. JCM 10914]